MIRCNLSVLLAERNLKITKVSNDTGISRTTLTALCKNHSQGIQFDTMNILCKYLKVAPAQLICYIPYDFVDISVEDSYISFNLVSNELTSFYELPFSIHKAVNPFCDDTEYVNICVVVENQNLVDILRGLSASFSDHIKDMFCKKILEKENIFDTDNIGFCFKSGSLTF